MCILTTMMTYFPFLFDYPSLPFHILEIFIAPIILFLCIKIHLQTNCSNSNSAFPPDSNTGRHSNNANFQTTNIFTPHFLLHVNRSYKKKTRVIYLESLIFFFKRTHVRQSYLSFHNFLAAGMPSKQPKHNLTSFPENYFWNFIPDISKLIKQKDV